jgi:hypothetical protein
MAPEQRHDELWAAFLTCERNDVITDYGKEVMDTWQKHYDDDFCNMDQRTLETDGPDSERNTDGQFEPGTKQTRSNEPGTHQDTEECTGEDDMEAAQECKQPNEEGEYDEVLESLKYTMPTSSQLGGDGCAVTNETMHAVWDQVQSIQAADAPVGSTCTRRLR